MSKWLVASLLVAAVAFIALDTGKYFFLFSLYFFLKYSKVENRCLDEHFCPFSVPKKRSGVTVVEWCPLNEKAFLIYVYTVDKAFRERPNEGFT